MIGFLRGLIVEKQPPHIVLDVHGVGYTVAVPMTAFYQLPELNQEVRLFTHFVVREDAHTLYGFLVPLDRQLFQMLLKVNGVGPKLALAILSGMSTQEFVSCIQQGEIDPLLRLPGVGKKTAERLFIEIRDRLSQIITESEPAKLSQVNIKQESSWLHSKTTIEQEAVQALVALGYGTKQAQRVVALNLQQQSQPENLTAEELIRLVLKSMLATTN